MTHSRDINNETYYLHYIPLDIAYLKTDKFINTLIFYLKYGILSRRLLEQYLEYGKDYRYYGGNLHGNDYVPLTCIKPDTVIDRNIKDNDFILALDYPTLVISQDIEKDLTFRPGEYQKMTYEVHIKDIVPSEYIIGLRLPFNDSILKDGNKSKDEIIAMLDPYERIYQYIEELGFDITLYSNKDLKPIPRIQDVLKNKVIR